MSLFVKFFCCIGIAAGLVASYGCIRQNASPLEMVFACIVALFIGLCLMDWSMAEEENEC